MFPHITEYDGLSKAEIIKKTDDFFKIVENTRPGFFENIDKYTRQINCIFSQKNEAAIASFLELMSQPGFEDCCRHSQEFLILSIFKTIIPLEQKNGLRCSFLSMNSLDDAVTCYTRVVFCFRRIEFDFPLEDQLELVKIINDYEISPIYLYYVLSTALLDNRKKIAVWLSNLFASGNLLKWAELFNSFK